MILAVPPGKDPTMRHLGRVHRVSLQWMHGRLGNHPHRGGTILYYEVSGDMSADTGAELSINPINWSHAFKFIIVASEG